MRRPSALDRMVYNFQHNWETNPQFRALWSGGFGLTLVVVMCACLGVAFTFAGTAAAKLSSSNSDTTIGPPADSTVRAGSADANVTFPTPTVPAWAPPLIPAGAPIPPSLTPAPTPTAPPTPTPAPTAPPPPQCNNNCNPGKPAGTVSITSTTPSPLKAGAPGSVVIHTSQPNVPVEINITWQTGAFAPFTNGGGGYLTDANGDYTLSFSVPSGPGCGTNTINFWITAGFPGGTVDPTISEQCVP